MKKVLLPIFLFLFSFFSNLNASEFLVEDFESKAIGAVCEMKAHYDTDGTATVVANPADATNKAAQITTTNWDAFLKLNVTLPAGKTLADYESLSFDVYWKASEYKNMKVFVDDDVIFEETDYPSQGAAETWITKNYKFEKLSALTADILAKSSFALSLGISTDAGDYYIDNIVLNAVKPVFVVENFESKTIGAVCEMKAHYDTDGTATVVANPADATNKAAQITTTNWDAFLKLNVTLPAGKTLADYESLSFDVYWKASEYKNMKVFVDDDVIFEETNYPSQGAAEKWLTNTYKFEKLTALTADILAKSSFALSFGISTDAGDYFIDNVILVEKTSSTAIGNAQQESFIDPYMAGNVFYLGNQVSEIYLYDIKGTLLLSAQNISSVDVSALTSGIYLAKINVNGQTFVSKFLK